MMKFMFIIALVGIVFGTLAALLCVTTHAWGWLAFDLVMIALNIRNAMVFVDLM